MTKNLVSDVTLADHSPLWSQNVGVISWCLVQKKVCYILYGGLYKTGGVETRTCRVTVGSERRRVPYSDTKTAKLLPS